MSNARIDSAAAGWDAGWWLAAERRYSPNFNARPEGTTVDLVVLHHISLPPGVFGGDEVARAFREPAQSAGNAELEAIAHLQVSAHFFLRRGGSLQQFVSCDDRAWQAGVSCWHGRHACNDYSIGIEIEGDAVQPSRPHSTPALDRCCSHRGPLSGPRGHHAQRNCGRAQGDPARRLIFTCAALGGLGPACTAPGVFWLRQLECHVDVAARRVRVRADDVPCRPDPAPRRDQRGMATVSVTSIPKPVGSGPMPHRR